jgi:hypothetical protein
MSDTPDGVLGVLEKLPLYQGLTWRGAEGALAGGISLPAPLPTSRNVRIASGNFASPFLWAIVSSAGRDVSPFSADPSAQEVALLPGSLITPASGTIEVEGVRFQIVLEVRDGVPVGSTPTEGDLASLIQAARTAEPATISQPGRFG